MNRLAFLLFCITGFSQSNAQTVYEVRMTKDFQYTESNNFFYLRLLQPYKDDWAFTDYDRKKNKIQTGFFTDSSLATQTGHNRFYDYDKIVYEGNFSNGLRVGWWYFYNKKGILSDSLYYVITQTKNKKSDSLRKKEAVIFGEHLRDTSLLFERVETEAGFRGGDNGWIKHLNKTLSFPDLAVNMLPAGSRTSVVQFVVCTDGMICDLQVVQSTHPLLDLEAVSAIRKGGNWIPAEQDGRKVKAYRKQPITFVLQ